jgi:predicted small secreted protein
MYSFQLFVQDYLVQYAFCDVLNKIKYPKQKIDGEWYVNKESMNEIYSRSTLVHGKGINGPYGKYGKLTSG